MARLPGDPTAYPRCQADMGHGYTAPIPDNRDEGLCYARPWVARSGGHLSVKRRQEVGIQEICLENEVRDPEGQGECKVRKLVRSGIWEVR